MTYAEIVSSAVLPTYNIWPNSFFGVPITQKNATSPKKQDVSIRRAINSPLCNRRTGMDCSVYKTIYYTGQLRANGELGVSTRTVRRVQRGIRPSWSVSLVPRL